MNENRKLNTRKKIGLLVCGAILGNIVISSQPISRSVQAGGTINEKSSADFNVGQGIQWPEQVFAPFFDVTAYVSDAKLGNSGAPNLKELALQSGTKYFNLGFIQAVEIGKLLKLSPAFPLLHTVRATFTAHGAPSKYY